MVGALGEVPLGRPVPPESAMPAAKGKLEPPGVERQDPAWSGKVARLERLEAEPAVGRVGDSGDHRVVPALPRPAAAGQAEVGPVEQILGAREVRERPANQTLHSAKVAGSRPAAATVSGARP
jgi:hypothetical protein